MPRLALAPKVLPDAPCSFSFLVSWLDAKDLVEGSEEALDGRSLGP